MNFSSLVSEIFYYGLLLGGVGACSSLIIGYAIGSVIHTFKRVV